MPVRTIRIIWLALFVSVLIYGLVIFIAVPEIPSTPFESTFSNPIIVILHVMGVMVFSMAFVVSSFLLRRHAPAPPSPPGTVTVGERTRLALIIRWALIESSAVFGLLAAFVAQDPRLFALLGSLAVVGMLASYPTDERLQDMDATVRLS